MIHGFNTEIAERYGIEEAILIEILYAWIHKNKCDDVEEMTHEGRVWCRSSAKGIAKYVPYMKSDKIWRTLKKLVEKDVIDEGNFNKIATNQTLWYSFTDKLKDYLVSINYDLEKIKNKILKNEKCNNSIINNPIIKDNTIKESLSNDKQKKSRFVKPTIEQIAKYIEEKKMHFDAERFFDYYESTGWMVGRNHMKDWKAACRTWEHKRKQEDDKEEQKKADEIPADDIDPWKRFQDWCVRKITHIGRDKITYQDFAKMRAVVTFNSALMADILLAMDKSGFDGDIVKEFERMAESDEFSYRRF
jgi:NACalpha-BTF3-like transcription factor